MRTVAAPLTEGDNNPATGKRGDRALRWAAGVGWIVLATQLAAMIVFNVIERDYFGLTLDEASYYQGWWLISRGHLDPFSTTIQHPFWKNNGEWISWPLALLSRPILSQTSFLIIEDLFLVGAGVVGLIWILEVVRRPSWPARFPPWLAVSTYVVLVGLNPWLYTSVAWAWHYEPLDVLLLMLVAYFVEHRQWKRAAVFVALSTATGSTGAVLLAGLGIATLLAGRRWRWPGAIILLTGVVTVLFLSSLKMQGGNIGHLYGYVVGAGGRQASNTNLTATQILKGAAEHPNRVVSALWGNRLNIYANLGPSGIIGVFTPLGFGVPLVSLMLSEAQLSLPVGIPSFQNVAVYPFVTFGTILVLRRIALNRRVPRHLSAGLAGVVTANALLWAAVWAPKLPEQWLRVSAPATVVLRHALDTIPSDAEVFASQGIIGSFAQRQWIYAFEPGLLPYPVMASTVYFVVAPNQGIESVQVSDYLSAIAYLADDLHAKLIEQSAGVWVFRWNPPKGRRSFRIGYSLTNIPAWTAVGAAGIAVDWGTPADWLVASTGRAGYVVSGDYWRRGIGHYQANVTLSSNIPVNIEVWNETSNSLLARRILPSTRGLQDVSFGVNVTHLATPQTVSGGGLYKILPIPPAAGNAIEIRVWSSGNGGVSVYRLGLRKV